MLETSKPCYNLKKIFGTMFLATLQEKIQMSNNISTLKARKGDYELLFSTKKYGRKIT